VDCQLLVDMRYVGQDANLTVAFPFRAPDAAFHADLTEAFQRKYQANYGGLLPSGTPEADRYLLGLDPHAPDTHAPLASAMMRVGIAPTLIGTRGAHPALRISGRRRLLRLVENVGEPPDDAEALLQWPRV